MFDPVQNGNTMLGRSTKQNRPDEASEPLLNSSREHLGGNDENHEGVLFALEEDGDDDSLDDDQDIGSVSPQPSTNNKVNARSVRFEDDVHIIAPPLRSTTQSREVGVSNFYPFICQLTSSTIMQNLISTRKI